MPSQYSDEVKADVLARARLGRPARQIAAETNLPERTTQEWIHDARELAQAEDRDPMLVNGEYRLAFLTQDLTEQAVLSLKESGEPLHKYLVPLNIVRGTAIDKILKQPSSSSNPSITINVTIQPKPTIEADYTVVEDA